MELLRKDEMSIWRYNSRTLRVIVAYWLKGTSPIVKTLIRFTEA